jgi:nucleoside-diphosphate-sugar epimerase
MKAAYKSTPDTDVALTGVLRGRKVLVTGATGFIGGRLVERLSRQNDVKVRCIIRDFERTNRLTSLPVELVHADLRNAAAIDSAIKGVNYVFHCAYDWHSRRQNIEGMHILLAACATHAIDRLIHVSTFSVYKALSDGPLTEEAPDGDRSSKYVDIKLDLEQIVLDAVRSRGLAATIVQPTIVYGPFSGPWTDRPAEMLIFGEVILPDSGEGLCNAVYIDDVVDGLILAATSPKAVGERFILSGPEPVTWATFFTEIARALGTKPPKFLPLPQVEKSCEQSHTERLTKIVLNPKRLLKFVVGWNPAYKALKTAFHKLPGPLRKRVRSYYAAANRTRGEIFVLDSGYNRKISAGSEKARLKLGYSPRTNFQRGMELTGPYLEWAYGDLTRSSVIGRDEHSSENAST